MERESPVFKEIVKAGLTPMLSTLTIMESAETESEVLGLGLSVIALNIGNVCWITSYWYDCNCKKKIKVNF